MTQTTEDALIARLLARTQAGPAPAQMRERPAPRSPQRAVSAPAAKPPMARVKPPAEPVAAAKRAWNVSGIDGKARITTAFGQLPIEALRRRDELRTHDGHYIRVQWVDRIFLDSDFLTRHPQANPIVVRAGAFGRGIPERDVAVSPSQAIVKGRIPQSSQAVKAETLRGMPGFMPSARNGMTYYRFHCGEPVIVQIDGLWVRVAP